MDQYALLYILYNNINPGFYHYSTLKSLSKENTMNRFQLCSIVLIFFLFTSKIKTASSGSTVSHSRQPRRHVFQPTGFKGQPPSSMQFGEEKRRVPTGSNPLHNKR
ncbi:hypothetical protein CXB51_016390 [Gossypium anomalum]|uniref:Uncharacterized protein n=7 Tax=Gossypium TaxID=3633 RepID=A0A8J5YFK2_9ROSI|nr:hypothetical protein ERO13_A07G083600v2 [Gossypium hirsutum]KAG8488373.1 hypothetical protein CXB51_016390 [Gossypium anomalum]TYG60840.1 hypothetical protein ES288_D07G099800v1 [Gossypium darwinii]TYH62146.1 hypothetical protein ES332_D07G099300v1 [Gossypium tomentosum]TYJ26078.1 hypothetical protein E1A91_A07G094700v1 [Gossypium mustelinum]